MLKKSAVYLVSVTMKDQTELTCALLTRPTIKTLQQVAETHGAKLELKEALAFSRPITLPGVDQDDECSDGSDTKIVVSGVVLGNIHIEALIVYSETCRKRQKKTTEARESIETTNETDDEQRWVKPL